MGNCRSRAVHQDAEGGERVIAGDVIQLQSKFNREYNIPIEIQVAHFTPSSFPMVPIITHRSARICAETWKLICSSGREEDGSAQSGITIFYNDFYERLAMFDSSGRFDAVLSRNTSGQNKIAAKGAIIVRIVQFLLQIEEDSEKVQLMLFMLGKSHAQKGIRPWQYSIFVQTLLLSVAHCLGRHATNDVMECWVNLFAFVMRSMLPEAIRGQVVVTEMNINTSTVVGDERIHQELLEVEEMREMKRKLGHKDYSELSSLRPPEDYFH